MIYLIEMIPFPIFHFPNPFSIMAVTDNNPTMPNPTASNSTTPNQAPAAPAMAKTPMERMAGGASVSRAFGEPIAAQGHTIIPVAMVAMGFRGGFSGGFLGRVQGLFSNAGAGQQPTNGTTIGTPNGATNGTTNGAALASDGQSHGGMMRRMMVRPVGYIDVSSTGSRFVPIGRGRFVVLGIALAFVAGGFVRRRQLKMAKKS